MPLAGRNCQSHSISPVGYQLPVVNECLVYVWKIPSIPGAVPAFASSRAREGMFTSQPTALIMLWGRPRDGVRR